MLEQWLIDQLNPLQGEKLIILADPQRMIRAGAQAVDGWAKDHGFTVLFCSGNLALREMYENLRGDPKAKIILVDRTREKARLPLFYPDLEARCKSRARLTITLRDFLVEKTGDQRWPLHVNSDRNISRIVLDHLERALEAYDQLRDVDEHRLQDSDLYKIVLGATLGVNPFKRLSAGEIRRLCIENHDRLEKIKELFSAGAATDASEVLQHLRDQIEQADKPWCWMLDHEPEAVVRAFTLSAIMHQHGLEYSVLPANFDVGLERFKAIPKKSIEYTIKDMLKADPDQMVEDVAAVETFLKEEPEKAAGVPAGRSAAGRQPRLRPQGAAARSAWVRSVRPTVERGPGEPAGLLHQRPAAADGRGRHPAGAEEPILAGAYRTSGRRSPETRRGNQVRRPLPGRGQRQVSKLVPCQLCPVDPPGRRPADLHPPVRVPRAEEPLGPAERSEGSDPDLRRFASRCLGRTGPPGDGGKV